ncbi:Alpha-ketoglutarate-dependent dioxygenase alkB [Hondaea fermentalgiana]|uniref:Alpha-ketoglutarate-dependent dioxygenase alkB n=1 Tax=Hondaea fermentalgiana TaxID=2315210 RepID=A0A2R5GG83_9STRA|nr:Alpha-ketoglutarate-dependent dioxygenase alkB [Hondaea fermentalgiana]|eukprot:GBG29349.1 Alpha-ketoglutarate-dependent dioxygenase alkB [Hondaea fermentalgiana]
MSESQSLAPLRMAANLQRPRLLVERRLRSGGSEASLADTAKSESMEDAKRAGPGSDRPSPDKLTPEMSGTSKTSDMETPQRVRKGDESCRVQAPETQTEAETETENKAKEEVFRNVWKHFKRKRHEVTAYVKRMDTDSGRVEDENVVSGQKRKRATEEIDLLDFCNLDNSPKELVDLVKTIEVPSFMKEKGHQNDQDAQEDVNGGKNEEVEAEEEDFCVTKAYGIEGRPGFIFVPNPFVSTRVEAKWVERLAVDYASGDVSERNRTQDGEESALSSKLRWATLGYHYDWSNRRYTEDRKSPFPRALGRLAKQLVEPFAMQIEPETAIVNYYRAGTTMGGHKDDAEWTDDAPVVSISFGNAGVYVLGGDSQTDARPPGPVPLIVRNGDVVILGGPSRMNIHGVPCMMQGTLPSRLLPCLPPAVASYLEAGRINVNVRQVKPRTFSTQAAHAALGALRRVPK